MSDNNFNTYAQVGRVPQPIYLTKPVTGTVATSGTTTISGTVSLSAPVTISGAIGGTVAISGVVAISGTMTGTVAGSGVFTTYQSSGNTSIVGTVATSGTITGTVATSGVVTTSGTVTGTVALSGTSLVSGTVAVTTVKPDGTNTQPSMDAAARAGFQKITDGTDTLAVSTTGRLNIIEAVNFAYADTNFVVGDSPITLAIITDLGRNANAGFIANDGPGNIQIEISFDGTNYGTAWNMLSGECFPIDGLSLAKIRLTWIANSSYRVVIL